MKNTDRGYDLERRTCAWLISLGYLAERTATTGNRYSRKDLFGCVDLISVHADHGVELHQVTVRPEASKRRKKIREAQLGWPVRLWLWEKDARGRWVSTSEEVKPVVVEITTP